MRTHIVISMTYDSNRGKSIPVVRDATFVNFPDESLKPEVHKKPYYGMEILEVAANQAAV